MHKLNKPTQSNPQIKPKSASVQFKSFTKTSPNNSNHNPTNQIKSNEDGEFNDYLNKGKKMIQVLQGSFKQTSEGKFIFNTSLFINPINNPIKAFNDNTDCLVVIKRMNICNTAKGQAVIKSRTPSIALMHQDKDNNETHTKVVFETLFNSKFKGKPLTSFRKNSSNSNITTTRENTSRPRHVRISSTRNTFRTEKSSQLNSHMMMTMKHNINNNDSVIKQATPIKLLAKGYFKNEQNHRKHKSLY